MADNLCRAMPVCASFGNRMVLMAFLAALLSLLQALPEQFQSNFKDGKWITEAIKHEG